MSWFDAQVTQCANFILLICGLLIFNNKDSLKVMSSHQNLSPFFEEKVKASLDISMMTYMNRIRIPTVDKCSVLGRSQNRKTFAHGRLSVDCKMARYPFM